MRYGIVTSNLGGYADPRVAVRLAQSAEAAGSPPSWAVSRSTLCGWRSSTRRASCSPVPSGAGPCGLFAWAGGHLGKGGPWSIRRPGGKGAWLHTSSNTA
jgi:hypothetical protein